jgi:hypothetical protein
MNENMTHKPFHFTFLTPGVQMILLALLYSVFGWYWIVGFAIDFHVPLVYGGDALSYSSLIKRLIDGAWYFNNSSLPEVSAGAALEVDPLSIHEIKHAMQRLLEDETLVKSCIAKGLERAKLLTWDRCVAGTLAVYQSI